MSEELIKIREESPIIRGVPAMAAYLGIHQNTLRDWMGIRGENKTPRIKFTQIMNVYLFDKTDWKPEPKKGRGRK